MLASAITSTLCEYLLTLDCEVSRKFNPLHLRLLTYPSSRSGTLEGFMTRSARFVIRITMDGELIYGTLDILLLLHPCASTRSDVWRIPHGTCLGIDRFWSLLPSTGSGRFVSGNSKIGPNVRHLYPPTDRLEPFITGFAHRLRNPTDVGLDNKCRFCANTTPCSTTSLNTMSGCSRSCFSLTFHCPQVRPLAARQIHPLPQQCPHHECVLIRTLL